MNRLLRLLAVVVVVVAGFQLLTEPTASARRTDPVVLNASALSVKYAKQLTLTANLAAPQPDAQIDFYAKVYGEPARTIGSATAGGDARAKVSLTVNRTASYYAVLMVGGVAAAQSASVDVVVAPLLKLTAARVIGPIYHFMATVQPASDGIPVVLQRLVGTKWKKMDKGVSVGGKYTYNVDIPADTTSKWRLYVRGGTKWGASTSKSVRVTDY